MSKIIHKQQFIGSISNGCNGTSEFNNQPTQYHPHQKQLNPLHQQQHEKESCIETHMGQGTVLNFSFYQNMSSNNNNKIDQQVIK
jgi:hypothetical protein